MTQERSSIARKFVWTTGLHFGSIAVRFLTSVALSRLLAPEILGIMVLAHSVRIAAELLGDIGLEQNVIRSSDGDEEAFLNTVWTMQIARGAILSALCCCFAPLLSSVYEVDIKVFLAISAAPFFNALASTAIYTLSRRLHVAGRNLFELAVETAGLVINIVLAFQIPTIWAPVLGVLFTLLFRSALSYLLPGQKHRLMLSRSHFFAILNFGKWITLSSAAFYLTLYVDRLYLAGFLTIGTLGVYGLARTMADLPTMLASRIGYQIIFPLVAADREREVKTARGMLAPTRMRFLLLAAVGTATLIAWSDWIVGIVYDDRYSAASYMLSLLLVGSWAGILSAFCESAVLGSGRPQVTSFAHIVRISLIAVSLPVGFKLFGLPGAILGLAIGEVGRYLTLVNAQRRTGMSFLAQDLSLTCVLIFVLVAWISLRSMLGMGEPWSNLMIM